MLKLHRSLNFPVYLLYFLVINDIYISANLKRQGDPLEGENLIT